MRGANPKAWMRTAAQHEPESSEHIVCSANVRHCVDHIIYKVDKCALQYKYGMVRYGTVRYSTIW